MVKHQATSIHSADYILTGLDQIHAEILQPSKIILEIQIKKCLVV